MEQQLTYQSVLQLIKEQSLMFHKSLEESSKKFESDLEKERKERELSRKEFDKKLGDLTGTWGKFVAEMVKPKIVQLFKNKGIEIETAAQNIEGFKDGKIFYEIDLLLVNTNCAVAVEIKSTLTKKDVDEHLERLDKIKLIKPKAINLNGITLYGAIAGIIVEQNADRYAYKKGLYVLRQKGDFVEIVNDSKFAPKEWKVEY